MESRHNILKKILNIQDGIKSTWIKTSFIDRSIENDYNTYLKGYYKHLFFIMNIVSVLYIATSFCTSFLLMPSLVFEFMLSSFFVADIVLTFLYYKVAKREFALTIIQGLKYAIIYIVTKYWVFFTASSIITTDDIVRYVRCTYFSIYFVVITYYMLIGGNIASVTIITSFEIITIILTQIYIAKIEQSFLIETVYTTIFNGSVYYVKIRIDKFCRENFIQKYKFEKFFNYCDNIIGELNAYHVNISDNKIIYTNDKFKELLGRSPQGEEDRTPKNNSSENPYLLNKMCINESRLIINQLSTALEYLSSMREEDLNDKFADLKGKNLLDAIKSLQQVHHEFSNNFINLGNYSSYDSSGETKYFNVFYRMFQDDVNYIEIIFTDITELKRAEKTTFENNLKREFLAKIAHEFKTPLNTILGLISEIKDKLSELDVPEILLELDQVNDLSNYTIFLINDVIHYSSHNLDNIMVQVKVINLYEICEFCFNVLKTLLKNKEKKKNILPILEYDKTINDIIIKSDDTRVKQILLNFVSNAVKFTKSGSIKLKAEIIEQSNIIQISITDTGLGIKEDDKELIFEANTMLKTEWGCNKMGTGIGLSICKYIAEKLKHKVSFTSKLGEGSTFSVFIPFKKLEKRINSSANINFLKIQRCTANNIILSPAQKPKERMLTYENSKEDLFDKTVFLTNMDFNLENLDQLKTKIIYNQYNSNYISLVKSHSAESMKIEKVNQFVIKPKSKSSEGNLKIILDSKMSVNKSLSGQILIVDDSQYIRISIRRILVNIMQETKKEYEIIEASDGIDILKHVSEDQNNNNIIKCIITDENMEYLNGSECIQIIRRLEDSNRIKKVVCICATSLEDNKSKDRLIRSGMDFVISKPISKGELLGVLTKIGVF